MAPVSASTNRTRCQLSPPSRVRYTPRSSEAAQRLPAAATQSVSGSLGCTMIRPTWRVFSSPRRTHVRPPSSERYTPAPQGELCRLLASPVPTYTIRGSEGATATSPIELTASWANSSSQVVPRLDVFHNPPVAAATYHVSPSTAAISAIRPPITAGPIGRKLNPSRARSIAPAVVSAPAAGGGPAAPASIGAPTASVAVRATRNEGATGRRARPGGQTLLIGGHLRQWTRQRDRVRAGSYHPPAPPVKGSAQQREGTGQQPAEEQAGADAVAPRRVHTTAHTNQQRADRRHERYQQADEPQLRHQRHQQ